MAVARLELEPNEARHRLVAKLPIAGIQRKEKCFLPISSISVSAVGEAPITTNLEHKGNVKGSNPAVAMPKTDNERLRALLFINQHDK